MTQIFDATGFEFAFLGLKEESIFSEYLQNAANEVSMDMKISRENEDVVKIDHNDIAMK